MGLDRSQRRGRRQPACGNPPEIVPPRPDGVVTLLELASESQPDLAVFLRLAAVTGARRSELLALRWRDVDWEERTVRISRGVVIGAEGVVEKDTKTHSARVLALDDETLGVLRELRARRDERAEACGVQLVPEAFVFSNDVGGSTPWRPDSTTRAFNRLRTQAGLPDVRLHDLRHYVATRLVTFRGADLTDDDVASAASWMLGCSPAALLMDDIDAFPARPQLVSPLGTLLDRLCLDGTRVAMTCRRWTPELEMLLSLPAASGMPTTRIRCLPVDLETRGRRRDVSPRRRARGAHTLEVQAWSR